MRCSVLVGVAAALSYGWDTMLRGISYLVVCGYLAVLVSMLDGTATLADRDTCHGCVCIRMQIRCCPAEDCAAYVPRGERQPFLLASPCSETEPFVSASLRSSQPVDSTVENGCRPVSGLPTVLPACLPSE